jgi:hypothetical protein
MLDDWIRFLKKAEYKILKLLQSTFQRSAAGFENGNR